MTEEPLGLDRPCRASDPAERALAELGVTDATARIELHRPAPQGLRVPPNLGEAPGGETEAAQDDDRREDPCPPDWPRQGLAAGEPERPERATAGQHREAQPGQIAVPVGGDVDAGADRR